MADRHLSSFDDVEAALADLADHIDHPQATDLSAAVIARLDVDPHPKRRPLVPVAIAAALFITAVLALPAPREALADWLGIGSVSIVRTNDVPKATGATLRLGHEVSLEEAHRVAPFTVLGPSTLGAPSAVYIGEPSSDSVTLLWGAGGAVPPVTGTGVGVLLTEMLGSTDRALVEKQLGHATSLETVTIGDAVGYWIAGAKHELIYLDPNGRARSDTSRLAANTLLWTASGVTFRLESGLDRDAATDLATTLEPLS